MVNSTVVRASELGNRWDATYHVAFAQVKDRVAELQDTISAEDARAKLDGIAFQDKKALAVLARGEGRRSFDTTTCNRVVSEYPHLSLAIMERNLEPAIERIRSEMAKNRDALDHLLDLQLPVADAPKPGM